MNTKEKLIKYATKLFSQKGYHAVSIREIAKETGMNSSMISYYFKGKAGLYEAILNSERSKVVAVIKEIKQSELNPNERLIKMVDALNNIQTNDVMMLLIRALLNKKEKKHYQIIHDCLVKDFGEYFIELIKECQLDPKYSKTMDNKKLAIHLFSNANFWILYSDILLTLFPDINSRDELTNIVKNINKIVLKEFLKK